LLTTFELHYSGRDFGSLNASFCSENTLVSSVGMRPILQLNHAVGVAKYRDVCDACDDNQQTIPEIVPHRGAFHCAAV
jgi:hypothetical protein